MFCLRCCLITFAACFLRLSPLRRYAPSRYYDIAFYAYAIDAIIAAAIDYCRRSSLSLRFHDTPLFVYAFVRYFSMLLLILRLLPAVFADYFSPSLLCLIRYTCHIDDACHIQLFTLVYATPYFIIFADAISLCCCCFRRCHYAIATLLIICLADITIFADA